MSELLMEAQWLPVAPPAIEEKLERQSICRRELFRERSWLDDGDLKRQYEFNFPRLSVLTADLHFYKLLRVLNTPLASVEFRDAVKTSFAWWAGAEQSKESLEVQQFAHFWFFKDQKVDKYIIVEYGFDGNFRLSYSRDPADGILTAAYERICKLVNAVESTSIRTAADYTGPKDFK